MNVFRRILPLGALVIISACAARSGEENAGMEVTVVVENVPAALGSLTIYAHPRIGARRRVGSLTAARGATLTFRGGSTEQYVFVAEALAGRRVVSNPVTLGAGDTVNWDLSANIAVVTAGQ